MINVLKYLENTHSGVKEDSICAIVSAKCEWREKCEENCDSCQEVPCIESWDLKGSTFDFKLNTKECKDCVCYLGGMNSRNISCFEPRIIKGKVLEAIRFEKASYSGFEGIIDKKDALSPKQHLWIINQGLKDGDYILLELDLANSKEFACAENKVFKQMVNGK
jgi:hypothetical protein